MSAKPTKSTVSEGWFASEHGFANPKSANAIPDGFESVPRKKQGVNIQSEYEEFMESLAIEQEGKKKKRKKKVEDEELNVKKKKKYQRNSK